MTLPAKARAVIIGGGISGCSLAYHLAKLGWKDVVLLERKQLTSGTTWHAAGLIGQLRGSQNMTRLAKYSADLYVKLEAETGVATGMRQVGSISVALTKDRHEELLRQATLARAFDVAVTEISPAEVKRMYPHIEVGDVVGAVHLPLDGQCDPANIAMALAKGARMHGAAIHEGVKVTGVTDDGARVTGVDWETTEGRGHIAADIVINCGGMWGRDLAAQSGVSLPLHACEHFYLVTEPIEGLGHLPVLRVPDECAYYKSDAGKMMLGAFEPKAKPWGMAGIPEDFSFDSLPEDFDHFQPILEAAMHRMPMFQMAGIHTFFNGPESFTPDDRYYLGEAPELKGYWIAAGYNSIGIVSSGGAGMALAEWLNDGEPPFDLWEVDIRRAQPFQRNRKYLKERVRETVRQAGAGAGIQIRLGAAELVREPEGRTHGGAHWRGPVRHDQLRQDPGRGARRLRLFATAVRQRDGRRGGPHRLHPDAERARRDRVRPDGHAAVGNLLLPGGAGGDAAARSGLAAQASGGRVRGDHRCDGGRSGALRDGAAGARPDAPRQPG